MNHQELLDVVQSLNEKMWGEIPQRATKENPDFSCFAFSLEYHGYSWYIKFEDTILWSDDEDDRDYDHDTNEYEDLEQFVIKQFKALTASYQEISKRITKHISA